MGYLKDLLSLIYPEVCPVCGKSLFKNEKVVCMKCYHHLPRSRFTNDHENLAARVFWGRVPLQRVMAAFLYNKGNAVQQLIHGFKYRGYKEIGIFLGEELGKELSKIYDIHDIAYILPVPLHPKKQKKRGFNQSEIIARGIANQFPAEVNTSILVRKSFSSTQTRKSKYDRWQNVESIFKLKNPETIKNKHILIIDDVITTGATIEACVQCLLQAEGVKVSVGAVAYTRY
ncbi:MAG: ComF family protein [Bacteroidota bacterium]